MMEQQSEREVGPVPTAVTSPEAKLVCLYLDVAGPATVEDLNEALAMRKIAILSVLASLETRDVVDRRDGGYVTTR